MANFKTKIQDPFTIKIGDELYWEGWGPDFTVTFCGWQGNQVGHLLRCKHSDGSDTNLYWGTSWWLVSNKLTISKFALFQRRIKEQYAEA